MSVGHVLCTAEQHRKLLNQVLPALACDRTATSPLCARSRNSHGGHKRRAPAARHLGVWVCARLTTDDDAKGMSKNVLRKRRSKVRKATEEIRLTRMRYRRHGSAVRHLGRARSGFPDALRCFYLRFVPRAHYVETGLRKGRSVLRALLNFNPAAKQEFAQLPRVHDASASADAGYICDWAGLEEIDVILNGGQELALEAV